MRNHVDKYHNSAWYVHDNEAEINFKLFSPVCANLGLAGLVI
jgi:hypothetical protein